MRNSTLTLNPGCKFLVLFVCLFVCFCLSVFGLFFYFVVAVAAFDEQQIEDSNRPIEVNRDKTESGLKERDWPA